MEGHNPRHADLMVAMGAGYRPTTRTNLPKHWLPKGKYTHVAADDAAEQGELFMNVVRELNVQRGDVSLAGAPPPTTKPDRHERRNKRLTRRGRGDYPA